jgi:hypothetical protein
MKLYILKIIILGLILLQIANVLCKLENSNFLSIDEKDKKPEKVPIINVHMEEPDRDPLEVKRIEEERRIERNRIRQMETMEELDKRTFQQIISMQNSQLAKLTTIADKTSEILNRLSTKSAPQGGVPPPSPPQKMSFKQKGTYSTIFDKLSNGPIKFNNINK